MMKDEKNKMEFKIKFDSQGSDGGKNPDFETLSGKLVPVLEYGQRNIEKSANYPMVLAGMEKAEIVDDGLEKKLKDADTELTQLFETFEVDKLLNDELSSEKKKLGREKLSGITNKWDSIAERYDDEEKTPELLAEYEECKKELEELLKDVETWKAEKIAFDAPEKEKTEKAKKAASNVLIFYLGDILKNMKASDKESLADVEIEELTQEIAYGNPQVQILLSDIAEKKKEDLDKKYVLSGSQIKTLSDALVEHLKKKENNKDWMDLFKDAKERIVKTKKTLKEFKADNPKVELEFDFPFDLSEKFDEYLQKSDEHIDVHSDEEKKSWKKVLAAAKMINRKEEFKTCVIIEGITYLADARNIENDKDRREKRRGEAKEFLNKKIAEKLKEYCVKNQIHDATGMPMRVKTAIFRDMAFMVGGGIISDKSILDRLEECESKSEMSLLAGDEERINALMAEFENGNERKMHELLLKSHIYNVIGKINNDLKKEALENKDLVGKEKTNFLTDAEAREIVDGVQESFDDELKKSLQMFIDNRVLEVSTTTGPKITLDNEPKAKIVIAVKKYIVDKLAIKATPVVPKSTKQNEPIIPRKTDEEIKPQALPKKEAVVAPAETTSEKAVEKTPEELFEMVKEKSFGILTLELCQGWKDAYRKIVEENRLEDVEIEKHTRLDIEKALNRLGVKERYEGKESEKVVQYILEQLK